MKERTVYKDIESAINRLRNNGIGVDTSTHEVVIPQRRTVGIKLWGAIDYLKRFGKYRWVRE